MEQGLMVFGRTQLDNNKIQEFLDEYDFQAEFDVRNNYWFFQEDEANYDTLEMQLDKYFNELGINARFEGVFESKSINNLKFKTFEHYLSIVENQSKLRNVTVKFDNDDTINTDMAAHLSDDDIKNYYKIGKEFNVGNSGKDKMAKVVDVIINESSSTDMLYTYGGIIAPESEWSTANDSTLLNKDKQPIVYQLVKVGDKLFKTNHLDLMKSNIGKSIRFKYYSTEAYPTIIQPKLMGQIARQSNEASNKSVTPRLEMIELLKQKFPNLIVRTELFSKDYPNSIWSGAEGESFIDANKKIPAYNIYGSYSYNRKIDKNYESEVHKKLASFLQQHGWYTEFYDSGTPLFFPIYNTNEASDKAKDFISNKIKKLKDEGYPQKQSVAIAYSYAKKKGYKVNESIDNASDKLIVGQKYKIDSGMGGVFIIIYKGIESDNKSSNYGKHIFYHPKTSHGFGGKYYYYNNNEINSEIKEIK